jgi:hypothetical protein
LQLASAEEVADAHKGFSKTGTQLGIQELWDLKENGRVSFILSDINKNYWEITS